MVLIWSKVLDKLKLALLALPAIFFLSAYYDKPAGMRNLFLQMAYERLAYLSEPEPVRR